MILFTDIKKTHSATYFIIFILPFLLFYWMIPFVTDQTLGNDYQTYSIENQMEIQFSIKNGSFPLYIPGFALGHSSSALTLGQIFHPISYIASVMPGYWSGNSLELNTLLRLFSLGLTHIALFCFLRKLKLNMLFSFLLSCITVYNLRMLDMFRYGASLEAYTGYLLLCSAIGWYYINQIGPRGPICIIISTYLLVCSGHPQMMYYGLLGAGLFLFVIPFFIPLFLPEKQAALKAVLRFWLHVALFLGLGLLLSSAYVLPFYFEFIATNAERVKQGYAWADSIRDTFLGTTNNFFLPLRSDVHGAFGGSSMIIMAASLPALRLFRKIPLAVWSAWGVSLFVFLYMQGARTPIHQLVWEYLPLASSFRYSGRIAFVMPMFLMMILAWVIKAKPFSVRFNNRLIELTPATVLSVSSLILMVSYLLLLILAYLSTTIEFAPFAPVSIRSIPRFAEALMVLLGLSSLALIAFQNRVNNAARTLGVILCLVTLIQVGGSLKYGTWIAHRENTPTLKQMQAEKREELSYRFYPGTGMYSSIVTRQLENSFVEPFLGKIYHDAESVANLDDAYVRMLQGRTPQQVFIEGLELNNDLSGLRLDIGHINSKVDLIHSSFNLFKFRVFSPVPAFFGFSYPYTGHWNASINGQKVSVYRANGSAHAIELPKGVSLIEFRYSSPYFFWGVLISCLTFTLIALFIYIKIKRVSVVIVVLVLGVSIFLLWHHSLYTGMNLETEYTWAYEPPSLIHNLAYGKKTSMSSHKRGSPGYLHSSLAVDGERGKKTGSTAATGESPSWSVDLNRPEKIKSIIIYESCEDSSTNKRPLDIVFSDDGENWHTVYSVTSTADPNVPLRIFFERPESARYIKTQASGHTILRLEEVEIYGPENIN